MENYFSDTIGHMDKWEIIGLQSVSDFQVNYYDSTVVLRFNLVETGNLSKVCILGDVSAEDINYSV